MKYRLSRSLCGLVLAMAGCGPAIGIRVEHGEGGHDVLFVACDGSEPIQKYQIDIRKESSLICRLRGQDYRAGEVAGYQGQFLERWSYGTVPSGYTITEGGEWSNEASSIVCPALEPGFEYSVMVIYFGMRGATARFEVAQDGSVDMLTRGCGGFLWF